MFEPRREGGAIVFKREKIENNLVIPPCSAEQRARIISKIPSGKRHRFFGSMQSSQALTQSVFGSIEVLGGLPLLSAIKAEDGRPAFGAMSDQTTLELEKDVKTLGEHRSRATSVDVWFEGARNVAVECKLAETKFGECSRPRREPTDHTYCNGSYSRQNGRTERCSLTQAGALYWQHVERLFGWSSQIDHLTCPLHKTYQLSRNVLAACVDESGVLNSDRGHALLIYDERNPNMAPGGDCDRSWNATYGALRAPEALRRLSWQAFIAQWPNDPMLDWLKEEIGAKYGLIGKSEAREELCFRAITHATSVHSMDVGDIDGHTMSLYQFSGLASLAAGNIGVMRSILASDCVNGSSPTTSGYSSLTFNDGSALWFTTSSTAIAGETNNLISGCLSVVGGRGRYEGAKGDGVFKGARIGSIVIGVNAYVDYVINIKVSSCIRCPCTEFDESAILEG